MDIILTSFLESYKAQFKSSIDHEHLQKLIKETLVARANQYVSEHLLGRSTEDLLNLLVILSLKGPVKAGKLVNVDKTKRQTAH